MVGIPIFVWGGLFSGAMLVLGSVLAMLMPLTHKIFNTNVFGPFCFQNIRFMLPLPAANHDTKINPGDLPRRKSPDFDTSRWVPDAIFFVFHLYRYIERFMICT